MAARVCANTLALEICQLNQQIIHGLHRTNGWTYDSNEQRQPADKCRWKRNKNREKVLLTVFSRIHTYWLVNLVVLLEEYSYIWLRLFLVNLYPLRCWATILTNICISIIHIFMDDDAPGSIVLLGEIVFVHQRSPHPRADPLQFFSWMGHSKFYVGTLHSIYWWHIWSTFGLWYLPKWKLQGDFLESAATEMNNIPQCKYLEKSLEGKSAIFCKISEAWLSVVNCSLQQIDLISRSWWFWISSACDGGAANGRRQMWNWRGGGLESNLHNWKSCLCCKFQNLNL